MYGSVKFSSIQCACVLFSAHEFNLERSWKMVSVAGFMYKKSV